MEGTEGVQVKQKVESLGTAQELDESEVATQQEDAPALIMSKKTICREETESHKGCVVSL